MLRLKTIVLAAVISASFSFGAADAQAGPLLDWLRGIGKRPCNTCNQQSQYGYYQQNPTAAQYAGTAAPNAYNLQPGQCMKTCQQTCSRTVVNYVPATEYRTTWKKVPVTQYRPVTNSDPCTGCTVTCMKPCTTYTYQCQRVPYTTYRPVYRTETYKVPVTTITNDCATGNCGTGGCATCPQPGTMNGCSTCGVAGQTYQNQPVQNYGPTPAQTGSEYSYPANNPPTLAPSNGTVGSSSRLQVPGNTLSTTANYRASNVRAAKANIRSNVRPSSNRYESYRSDSESRQQEWNRSQPATVNVDDQTAFSPVTRRFSYSPVRLASYNAEVDTRNEVPVRSIQRNVQTRPTQGKSLREINSVWNNVK